VKIALVSDAWAPQINGVVTTLVDLVARLRAAGHDVEVIEPSSFRSIPCPGYPDVRLAWRPGSAVATRLDAWLPDAVHIVTEGPLGAAARAHCIARGWAFTTAFHTRFPEFLQSAYGLPSGWGYAWLRRFHAPSAGVLVPSAGTRRILERRGFRHLRRWTHGVDLRAFQPLDGADLGLPRPVFLAVGRVAPEKNLGAFLSLTLPGTKVVCGDGPSFDRLSRAHPEAVWMGRVPRERLPAIYAAADVLVHPSRTETFGLAMLEALACGTPVAAYPVDGPSDVLGDSDGGVLDDDLRHAALTALRVPRTRARARALAFDPDRVCRRFLAHVAPIRRGATAIGHGSLVAVS
jgi:glycosyltransferase involved in cell wall biosynthesis